jgi:hypothetical protein
MCLHDDKSLGEIVNDLVAITNRLESLRKQMKAMSVRELPVDGEKGQVMGRLNIHNFVADGEKQMRKIKADRRLKEIE